MLRITKQFIMAHYLQEKRFDRRKIGRKIRKIETKTKKLWDTKNEEAVTAQK